MFKRICNAVKEFVIEEYKFLFCMLAFYIVCVWPVNYYIVIGGGISDIGERINVDNGYDSKGSFNISYVSELKGTVLTYGLSYLIPSWERESINDYKYSQDDNYEDIEFRGELDLKSANGSAVKTAYTLADRDYKEISSKIYVIATFDEYDTGFEVQDELISIDNKTFQTTKEYSDFIQDYKSGDLVLAKVRRDGREEDIKCKIYEKDGRKFFGVALQIVKEFDTNPMVDINFKKGESGPSGGLITTLEIYNRLTKKDITNSLKIAGTGTVDEEGNVGSIGGVKYKLIGAAAGNADIFLVPAGKNYKEAMNVKKKKKLNIKVISVSTVDEAIEKLAKLK